MKNKNITIKNNIITQDEITLQKTIDNPEHAHLEPTITKHTETETTPTTINIINKKQSK